MYCAKKANSPYSICTAFNTEQGNILFSRINHTWPEKPEKEVVHDDNDEQKEKDIKCTYCGASKKVYDRGEDLENHAYQFIHTDQPQNLFGKNMKFDVIIGNPPYQLSDGGAQASAIPLYHKFVQQAKKLNPTYLSMIVPSRWFSGGKGLDAFRDEMLNDKKIKELHDFHNASDCFPRVEIKGGVCYFLWDSKHNGDCKITSYDSSGSENTLIRPLLEDGVDVFIRYQGAIPIWEKVKSFGEISMDTMISARKPFDLTTDFKDFKLTRFDRSIKIYANKKVGFVKKDLITKNKNWINKHKVIAPYAIGSGDSKTDKINPIYAEPESCCTETYILLGLFDSKKEADNLISYINTRFFHFFLTLKKNTQHATSKVYSLVPIQDFTQSWTDEKLYKKYDLTHEEIAFIESMIRPMELSGE